MALNSITTESTAKRKTFLSIAHGKIRHTNKQAGTIEFYGSVDGTLIDIYRQERTYNGNTEPFWYIELMDGGEIYALSFPYSSGTFKSIVNSLASESDLSTESLIHIEPYEKKGFTKVVVYSDGIKLDWYAPEMPAVKDLVLSNGQKIKDDRERMAFIESLVYRIRKQLGTAAFENDVELRYTPKEK